MFTALSGKREACGGLIYKPRGPDSGLGVPTATFPSFRCGVQVPSNPEAFHSPAAGPAHGGDLRDLHHRPRRLAGGSKLFSPGGALQPRATWQVARVPDTSVHLADEAQRGLRRADTVIRAGGIPHPPVEPPMRKEPSRERSPASVPTQLCPSGPSSERGAGRLDRKVCSSDVPGKPPGR